MAWTADGGRSRSSVHRSPFSPFSDNTVTVIRHRAQHTKFNPLRIASRIFRSFRFASSLCLALYFFLLHFLLFDYEVFLLLLRTQQSEMASPKVRLFVCFVNRRISCSNDRNDKQRTGYSIPAAATVGKHKYIQLTIFTAENFTPITFFSFSTTQFWLNEMR